MPQRLLHFEIIRRGLSFYRNYISVVIVSIALLGLVGFATDETVGLFYTSIFAAIFMVLAFHRLFGGGSAFFNVILANVVTVYMCFFAFFVESIFPDLTAPYITGGFLLPLVAFLTGAVFRKDEITSIVQSHVYINEAKFVRSFLWLIPIALIGVLAFALHQGHENTPEHRRLFFLGEMGSVSAVVFLASRDFTLMLIDTGVLFGEFFAENAKLIKSAFAFFIMYSFIIVVFAAIYKNIDYLSGIHHFEIHGKERHLSFVEAVYFSLVTVSTLGFGDIIPLTNAMRFIVGLQSFCGTLLFFFGVHAILGHDRHRNRGREELPKE
jgi:voltage-gated potassium channel